MADSVDIETFIEASKTLPVIDVRTPSEFKQGHIPGAHNLPLFSDEERAEIGTLYTQVSRDASIKRGLEFVGPKMRHFVEQSETWCPDQNVLVHCWRGGMRSQSLSWLLNFSGFHTRTLIGGYKAFRRFVLDRFSLSHPIIILGGMTGSGKTHLLHKLKEMGEQVIDLEGLAHHKGSAFGALGEDPQPTNEHFENQIAMQLHRLNPNRRIWLEDESIYIGKNKLPDDLFHQMRGAPVVEVKVSYEDRIQQLVDDYSDYPVEGLKESVLKIQKRLGGARTKEALEALDNEDFAKVANLTLKYYDKTYQYGLSTRNSETVFPISLKSMTNDEKVAAIIEHTNKIFDL